MISWTADPVEAGPWADAVLAAALLAVDPAGIGGVSLRARPGPARDGWLATLRALLPADAAMRKVPLSITDSRLLGGLDLAATLGAGRPIAERGVLAEADGGIAVLAMAERLPLATAARIAAVMDSGEIALERDGLRGRVAARFGVVVLDEGIDADERPPPALIDRCAVLLDLAAIGPRDMVGSSPDPETLAAARVRLRSTRVTDAVIETLCSAALAFGIPALRASQLALRIAVASAALSGRAETNEDDAIVAARLVYAARATRLPPDNPAEEPPPEQQNDDAEDQRPEPPPDSAKDQSDDDTARQDDRSLDDLVIEATRAALPPELLADLLRNSSAAPSRQKAPVGAGALQKASRHGRPIGARRGDLKPGARLDVIETLRAAAGWQKLRRNAVVQAGRAPRKVEVRRDDFRIARYQQRSATTTIFAVDASGSSALNRLAEAKGAVELLLADCYVRRDQVALIGFRGQSSDLILPPTRSLVRAKRGLSGLPGGGGTPLASGIDAASDLADAIRRKGQTAIVVLLTDGQANIARDGLAGRARAGEDARDAARRLRATGVTVLLVDTSPRRTDAARALAVEMGARYLPLPYADAATISSAVRALTAS